MIIYLEISINHKGARMVKGGKDQHGLQKFKLKFSRWQTARDLSL